MKFLKLKKAARVKSKNYLRCQNCQKNSAPPWWLIFALGGIYNAINDDWHSALLCLIVAVAIA